VPEIVAAASGADRVLDAGCGSARLTLALAEAGVGEVIGIDTSSERLDQGRKRLDDAAAGGRVELIEADFNAPLPFADHRFEAVTSRLALMIASDPVATLRELARVTTTGGSVVTALWAPVAENPWFGLPRQAAAAVLGAEQADYARVFGRIGSEQEAGQVHSDAGLTGVNTRTLREELVVTDAAGLWEWMVRENGHVRRIDSAIGDDERGAITGELADLCSGHRADDGQLHLARTMTLVIATTRG